MIKIKIHTESLENLEDKEDRLIFINSFKELVKKIFYDFEGFIDFQYISKYNQFEIKETNIDIEIIKKKLNEVNEKLQNSII